MTVNSKNKHIHKETGISMTRCGKNCMNHKFVEKKKGRFYFLITSDLEEILACMMDSDRYIDVGVKRRILIELKQELVQRGQKQYA